jgi:hypothetical protein
VEQQDSMTTVRSFRVPTSLVRSGALATISGDALRLFVYLSRAMYCIRAESLGINNTVIAGDLRLQRRQIVTLVAELIAAGLLMGAEDEDRWSFYLPGSQPANPF